jgi:hypothetical protein
MTVDEGEGIKNGQKMDFHADPKTGVITFESSITKSQRCRLSASFIMSAIVKVCGWRPHGGGAAHAGAGVRKPPKEMLWGGGEDIASS